MALIKKEPVTNYQDATFTSPYLIPDDIWVDKKNRRIRMNLKSYASRETSKQEAKECFMQAEVLFSGNPKDKATYKEEQVINVKVLPEEEFNALMTKLDVFYTAIYAELQKEFEVKVKEDVDGVTQVKKQKRFILNPEEWNND